VPFLGKKGDQILLLVGGNVRYKVGERMVEDPATNRL